MLYALSLWHHSDLSLSLAFQEKGKGGQIKYDFSWQGFELHRAT